MRIGRLSDVFWDDSNAKLVVSKFDIIRFDIHETIKLKEFLNKHFNDDFLKEMK